jgi:hypothetical protein
VARKKVAEVPTAKPPKVPVSCCPIRPDQIDYLF